MSERGVHNPFLLFIRVFAENLIGLGFLQSVSYIAPIPTHEKMFAVGKRGPNATFNLFFLGVIGLVLGWGVRRFHNNTYMFSQPNRIRKIANTLFICGIVAARAYLLKL